MRDTLSWYMGKVDERDIRHVQAGGPLALVGGSCDDLPGFADHLDPARPVLDLRRTVPSKRQVVAHYEQHPETIAIAHRPERVMAAIGLIA